jgi:hypothetical protein
VYLAGFRHLPPGIQDCEAVDHESASEAAIHSPTLARQVHSVGIKRGDES